MTDLVSPVKEAMAELAGIWKTKIWEGNVTPLAPSTVAAKIAKGSTNPDQPLVDTELMINSIESGVEVLDDGIVRGWIGIVNPARAEIAMRHEYGLGPPERPTLRPTVDENFERLQEQIFDNIFKQIQEEFYG